LRPAEACSALHDAQPDTVQQFANCIRTVAEQSAAKERRP
jgi:hypothetical protein